MINMLTHRQANGPAAWVYLMALLPPILLCVIAGLQPYVDPADLFSDAMSVARRTAQTGECCSAYFGFLSTLGGLIWAGGAFIAMFAATVLFDRDNITGACKFMMAAGALTLMLMVDDIFQGHEVVYPKIFDIPEEVTITIYALLVVAYLFNFRQQIIEAGPGLLVISLLTFALSVTADLFVSKDIALHRYMEDGSKLVGIFCWTTFHWWSAWTLINRSSRSSASPAT